MDADDSTFAGEALQIPAKSRWRSDYRLFEFAKRDETAKRQQAENGLSTFIGMK